MQKYLLKNKLSTWLNILIILSPHCNKENNSCVDDYFQWFELLFFVGIFTNGIFVRWLGFFFFLFSLCICNLCDGKSAELFFSTCFLSWCSQEISS